MTGEQPACLWPSLMPVKAAELERHVEEHGSYETLGITHDLGELVYAQGQTLRVFIVRGSVSRRRNDLA